jgi:probable HAF family extracellular repeat protein
MKLRVVPSTLLLILGGVSPVWSPSRQPRRQRPSPPTGQIWSGGVFQNLNNLIPPGRGFTLDYGTAINDNGQIVASGFNAQGQEHAFLLTQLVPAPRTYHPLA